MAKSFFRVGQYVYIPECGLGQIVSIADVSTGELRLKQVPTAYVKRHNLRQALLHNEVAIPLEQFIDPNDIHLSLQIIIEGGGRRGRRLPSKLKEANKRLRNCRSLPELAKLIAFLRYLHTKDGFSAEQVLMLKEAANRFLDVTACFLSLPQTIAAVYINHELEKENVRPLPFDIME